MALNTPFHAAKLEILTWNSMKNGLTFRASPTWQFEQFDCVFVFKKVD